MAICNTTLEDAYIHETPLWKGMTFHHFGLLISAIFGLISVVISLFLIWRHATHYLVPGEQKHIIRILFMVPVYSVVSFLSYLYYRHAVYFDVLRDCYEAFAISSFFALLCHYCAPTLHDQKEYFRHVVPVNWFWGVFGLQKCTGGENKGPFRKPRSGLTWFNVIWVGELEAMGVVYSRQRLTVYCRHLPILLHSSLLHNRFRDHAGVRQILRSFSFSSIRTHLGSGVRVYLGHYCHVYGSTILYPA